VDTITESVRSAASASDTDSVRGGETASSRRTPDSPARRDALLVAACRRLHRSETPVPLETLAAEAAMSVSSFQRLFRRTLGVTPRQYASHLQRERAQIALGRAPRITDAVFDAGFATPSRFYARVQEMLGMSPSAWRSGGAGVTIDHAVVDTALGPLLVAATERGVCRVAFGEHDFGSIGDAATGRGRGGRGVEATGDGVGGRSGERRDLVTALAARFPNAELALGGARFRETVDTVAALVSDASASRRAALALPLDIEGTLFQSQVWQVLRGIPAGRTMSYAEVAVALGRPSAHRAAANACASNPLALLIPCHRVLRSDGVGLGGYRWGVSRKRALLAAERARPGLSA